jgi:hypothetical protein
MSKKLTDMTPEELLAHATKLENDLGEEKAAHKATKEQAEEIVNKAQEEVKDAKEQAAKNAFIITHNKKKYAVKAKSFKFKNVSYKAEDLEKNGDLVKTLIECGSSILAEVK